MLDDILGQPYAVAALQNALAEGRVAGSYLFVGPDGVGKSTVALRFAAMLCGAKSLADPIAQAIFKGTFPDVRSVAPPATSPIISIAQIWPRHDHDTHKAANALLRDLHFEPMAGPKRVFLIQDAEGLGKGSGDSGNSILKTLEEPPAYAHFILTAVSTAAMMPTIVSRCQMIHFGLVPQAEIEAILIQRWEVPPDRARFLAAYSEGRLGRAVALARSPNLLAGRDQMLDLIHELVLAPEIASFKLGEEFRKLAPKMPALGEEDSEDGEEKKGRAPILRGLDVIAGYYRDMLSAQILGSDGGLTNSDRREMILADAAVYQAAHLERALEIILAVRAAIERNANTQLALEVLFTNLTSLRKHVAIGV